MPTKHVNSLSHLERHHSGGTDHTVIRTVLPSKPSLFTSCHGTQQVFTKRVREGALLKHGNRLWVPNIDCIEPPTICGPDSAYFQTLPCCPNGPECHFFFAQLGPAPPVIDWQSQLHDCTEADPPDATGICTHAAIASGPFFSWQTALLIGATATSPITVGGREFVFPGFGSFSAVFASQWDAVFGTPSPESRIVANNQPTPNSTQPNWINDGRPCSGSIATIPRTPIMGPNVSVIAQAQDLITGAYWNAHNPNFFSVSWWST